jgi:hypothetical protein
LVFLCLVCAQFYVVEIMHAWNKNNILLMCRSKINSWSIIPPSILISKISSLFLCRHFFFSNFLFSLQNFKSLFTFLPLWVSWRHALEQNHKAVGIKQSFLA